MEIIAGVDEAGRGPLAGPVVAAAVILPPNYSLTGLRDSKALTANKRETLYDTILEKAQAVGIGQVEAEEIDRINILKATQKSMRQALGRLGIKPDRALIDGHPLPSQVIPNEGVPGGDQKIAVIQAASIIAKVTRDRLMVQYDGLFPEYGFARHKGYGTEQHLKALVSFKACPIHRKSFQPVKAHLPTLSWLRQKRRIGTWGENVAAVELIRQSYCITDRNVTCGHYGEIDLVAESEQEIIFVEVKTVATRGAAPAELKVDREKLTRLGRAIDYYITKHKLQKEIRLDVIAVALGGGIPRLKHYRGIRLDEL